MMDHPPETPFWSCRIVVPDTDDQAIVTLDDWRNEDFNVCEDARKMTIPDKDRMIKVKLVGDPPNEKMVEVCDIEGCWETATQFHGTLDHLIRTCDAHAEQVMLELLNALFGE